METVMVVWPTKGEEQHEPVRLHGCRLVTRDDRGKLWTWLVPAGVCFEDSRPRLVNPKAAVESGRRASAGGV